MSPLAFLLLRQQYTDVSEQLLQAFRRALREAPGSIRALARAAGVSDALLIRVRDEERGLTPETVRALAGALHAWGERCHALADALEDAAETGGSDE